LQYLTKEHARQLLEQSASLLDTAYAVGLSGPGRLHDLFITWEAATPGEYKQRGAGLDIRYAFQPSPFGECLLAVTERGICGLAFSGAGGHPAALAELRSRWPKSTLAEDPAAIQPFIQQVFEPHPNSQPLPLFLSGSNFQLKVWEALLRIPAGSVASYEHIARWLGMPSAARAVSSAVARNPVAYLIPCHRIIRKLGDFGGYHYGTARKQAILGWEMAHAA
jgi:AraC family transcriptional regulator of adaptative response/methylated-DNA-[protein]-cysteine methyltransferase